VKQIVTLAAEAFASQNAWSSDDDDAEETESETENDENAAAADACAYHTVEVEDSWVDVRRGLLPDHPAPSPPPAGVLQRVQSALRRVLFISHWSPYDRVRVVNADP
jgi:hypothetical protein